MLNHHFTIHRFSLLLETSRRHIRFTVAGGNKLNRFSDPQGIFIDDDQTVYIAHWGNRRLMRWSRQNKINGQIIISKIDCSRLAIDKHGNLYFSDCRNHRIQKFEID